MALLLRSSTGPRRATAALATNYYNRSARVRIGHGLPGAVPPPLPPPTATDTSPRRAYATHATSLDLPALDRKWRRIWSTTAKQDDAQAAGGDRGDRTTADYILPMFPYPSGLLHLGHLRVYTIADTIARFRALQGRRVLLPMGWDAFGLPAENAARERGVGPAEWTRTNISRMRDQLDMMNGSWDWSHEITTCDPDFYRHTQKLFLMLHSRGLAYQAEADVNYDPVDGTVLANEQVGPDGRSWRSGALVERRRLTQWFFRISAFRDDLLRHLDALGRGSAWPERVLAQQRSWLGRSEGVVIKFPVLASGQRDAHAAIDVFTTRPDTLFGVQYLALSARHPAVAGLAAADPELQAFLDTLPGLPPDSKVGYLLPHVRAVNPLGSCRRSEGEEADVDDTPDDGKMSLPIYVAPYVVGDYGEGAVMGVPGHDLRDHAFWREHGGDQPIRVVLASSEDESTTALENRPEPPPGPFTEHGILAADVGPAFRGKSSREAGRIVAEMLERAGLAVRAERWRLRDWLISRQRYWGTPIPIIHCARDGCGPVPVPDEDLPVLLPDVGRHWEEGGGGNPLEGEAAARWREDVACPRCGGPARRDTDTMDTFVDSSWYYARFADPHNRAGPFANDAARATLPVDLYIGGVEHAILHLLYARFVYKFLATTPLLAGVAAVQDGVAEPFRRLVTQGMVNSRTYSDPATGRFLRRSEVDLADPNMPTEAATGRPVAVTFEKMSKSKHNGVDPSGCIAKHGADATRAHLLFQAPVGEVLNWDEDKISGITRWFDRIHDLVRSLASAGAAGRDEGGEKGGPEAGDGEDDAARVLEYLEGWHGRLAEESSSPIDTDELRRGDANTAIWRELQAAVGSVTSSYQDVYSLNTAVSDLMILTNAILQHRALADYVIVRAAASALVVMLAPIAPAVAEECWSILRPGSAGLFSHPSASASSASSDPSAPSASGARFPVQDGTSDLTQPRLRGLAVQVNGRLRAVVQVPLPAKGLEGAALREWIRERILEGASKAKFGPGGEYDLARATKVIVAGGGETINFVL